MADEKRKTEELIKSLTGKIISNSKDAKWAKGMLQQLTGLYQMDKLIDVPLKDVKESIDFGACAIHKVKDGYVFEAKGGLTTHVSLRLQSICTMLDGLVELYHQPEKTDEDKIIFENFRDAVLYNFQSIIFASINEKSLFDIATAILRTFNDYAEERFANAEPKDETTEDIKDNIQADLMAKGLEALAESPLPPEDLD